MTDVLLAHSYHLPHDAKQLRKMQPYPPLGTLYAATALRAAGIPVAVFDPMLAEPISGFTEMLRSHIPRIVVIYEDDFNFVTKMCLAHMRVLTQQLACLARGVGATVIAHGSDATDNAATYFSLGVDYVLVGEAEQTLTALCQKLLNGSDTTGVPGLISSTTTGATPHNAGAPKNPGWTQLPRLARDLIDMKPYREAWQSAHGYFSTNVVASRGCPFGCNWCAKPISGNKFQVRQPKDVVAEIWELKHVHHVQHIWFGDDIFALNRRWVEEFADEMQANDCVLPFKIQSRADLMTESVVDALRRAGCAEVWMGVESGSQKILNAMGKGLRISTVREARARLDAAGIRACYFLQFGYPGETWPEILETLEFVRSTRPDDIGVSVSYPLPGTKFHELVQQQLGEKRNWSDSDDLCGLFTTAYNDEFYRAVRDLLHAEVDGWQTTANPSDPELAQSLWRRVCGLEPVSRNSNALRFDNPLTNSGRPSFVPLHQLLAPVET
jgi:anaerobic magnesium-protoporphyrin IX monomethyl ester cyclase